MTIAYSKESDRVYGAYTFIDDKQNYRESYLFTYADDADFEKLNYKASEQNANKLHPAL